MSAGTTIDVKNQLADVYCAEFLKKHLDALENGEHTDLNFLVGQNEADSQLVYAHSGLLKVASKKFAELISAAQSQNQQTIRFKKIKPHIFKALNIILHFQISVIGSFDFIINIEDAIDMILAAEEYDVEHIVFIIAPYIKKYATIDNVWRTLNAIVHLPEVAKSCNDVLTKETMKCLQHETFTQASDDSFIHLLKLDNLNTNSEMDLVNACVKLQQLRPASLFDDVDTLVRLALPHLRLLTLEAIQIAPITKFLNPEERTILASKMIFKQDETELPPSLNGKTQPRNQAEIFNAESKGKVVIVPQNLLSVVQLSKSSLYVVNSGVKDRNIITFRACRKMSIAGVTIISRAKTNWDTQFLSDKDSSCPVSVSNFHLYNENLHLVATRTIGSQTKILSKLKICFPVAYNSVFLANFKEALFLPRGSVIRLTVSMPRGAAYHKIGVEKFMQKNKICHALNDKKEIIADNITWQHEKVFKEFGFFGEPPGLLLTWPVAKEKSTCIIKSIQCTILD